jgi:hypothetical protein
MHAYIHTYIHTYMHTYIHTYIHTCIRIRTHMQDAYDPEGRDLADEDVHAIMDALRVRAGEEEDEDETEESKRMLYEGPQWRIEI